MSTPVIGTITDPSTISTTASSGSSSSALADQLTNPANGLGENDFLNLLVTQLQNQDPLQPQDDSAFVAELAQFSSLQEMTGARTDLDTLVGDVQALQTAATAAVGGTTPGSTSTTSTSPTTPSSSSTPSTQPS